MLGFVQAPDSGQWQCQWVSQPEAELGRAHIPLPALDKLSISKVFFAIKWLIFIELLESNIIF